MKLLFWKNPMCTPFPWGLVGSWHSCLSPCYLLEKEREESDCWRGQGMELHVGKLLGTLIGPCWTWILIQLHLHSTTAITL